MAKQDSYLEKQRNTYFAVMKIPADVRPYFQGKTRFSTTLKTGNLSEANRRKWHFIEVWKEQVALARRTKTGTVPESIAEQAARYSLWLRQHQDENGDAEFALFSILDETVWRDYEKRDEAWTPLPREDTTRQEGRVGQLVEI
ncbi:DUF6538 domain-containing protein [uncultured Marivita sp.]|uniref:DUF6538 domain-containing protein n=2 Tax=Marivita TaxID=659428 RepID=UPI0025CC497E|nr:DUF6538 domain-containing protein [uncultured Marivita sp.]